MHNLLMLVLAAVWALAAGFLLGRAIDNSASPDAPAVPPEPPAPTSPTTAAAPTVFAAPSPPAPQGPSPPPPETQRPVSPRFHVVQKGETFASIARRHLGHERHWVAVARANPLVDPQRLTVGQKIRLPNADDL